MRTKLLIILALFFSVNVFSQDGPTAGSALRSLSGVDMITGKVIDVVFKESKDYTLFHFWSSQSDSCLTDFPRFIALVKQYDRKLNVYGFAYERKQDIPAAKTIVAKYKLNWSHLLQFKQADRQGAAVIDVLQINTFPTYMLLDKEGMILVRSNFLEDVEVVLKRLE